MFVDEKSHSNPLLIEVSFLKKFKILGLFKIMNPNSFISQVDVCTNLLDCIENALEWNIR